jgi:hypothetical protein
LLAWVCDKCNAGTKVADNPRARAFLLRRRIDEYGYAYMQTYIDGLPWKVKSQSLTLAAMLEPKEEKTR